MKEKREDKKVGSDVDGRSVEVTAPTRCESSPAITLSRPSACLFGVGPRRKRERAANRLAQATSQHCDEDGRASGTVRLTIPLSSYHTGSGDTYSSTWESAISDAFLVSCVAWETVRPLLSSRTIAISCAATRPPASQRDHDGPVRMTCTRKRSIVTGSQGSAAHELVAYPSDHTRCSSLRDLDLITSGWEEDLSQPSESKPQYRPRAG